MCAASPAVELPPIFLAKDVIDIRSPIRSLGGPTGWPSPCWPPATHASSTSPRTPKDRRSLHRRRYDHTDSAALAQARASDPPVDANVRLPRVHGWPNSSPLFVDWLAANPGARELL